ncbi:hypothetical protein V5F34_05470 [Xanthobacter autotrophicus]|uniref:hypothetical protein n=1 Tax=Xanthobacter autotrophicus TaxID=280 RepID=UPI00372CCC7C
MPGILRSAAFHISAMSFTANVWRKGHPATQHRWYIAAHEVLRSRHPLRLQAKPVMRR